MALPSDAAVECRATLEAHPADAMSPVTSIEVGVRRASSAVLGVTFRIHGDLASVCIPAPRQPRIAEELWQHTCCELFLRVPDADPYYEFNFSPSGEWTVYVFERYREGRLLADGVLDPHVQSSGTAGMLEVRATVALAGLSRSHSEARLALALSTVIEARDGSRSYWALAHPAEKPDFHHPDAFALTLDAVRN